MNKILERSKQVILVLIIVVVTLIVVDYFRIKGTKLVSLRDDLIYNYYSVENLETLMKDKLGEDYVGDIDQDFDNYVIKMVMEDLSSLEPDKYKRYNDFLSTDFMSKYNETREAEASSFVGKEISDEIYYISINRFVDGITYKEFKQKIEDMRNHKNLILDLRDNSGGNFKDLDKILDCFIEKDRVMYSLVSESETEKVISKSEKTFSFDNVVILVNNGTASVSELMTLSLKGNLENVKVVGTRTYGKQISYSIRTFKDKSAMVFISSIMNGPDNLQIGLEGIEPDVVVGNLEEFYQSIQDDLERESVVEKDKEKQLLFAIELLNK